MSAKPVPSPTSSHFLWVANGLLVLTVYGSIIPLRYDPMPLDEALTQFQNIQLYDPSVAGLRGDWVVNMIQYAVLSFCYMAGLCADRRRGYGFGVAFLVVPFGFALGLALEFLQLYFPPRTVSLNDLFLAWGGTLLGVGAWLIVGRAFTDWLRRFWSRRGIDGLATQALPAYLGLLLVALLMPFDFVMGMDEIAEKFDRGRVVLVPFGSLTSDGRSTLVDCLLNVMMFLPVGAMLALVSPWSRRSWSAILRTGLGLTLSLELLQLLVYTRYADVTDVVTGTIAIVIGWCVVRSLRDARDAERFGLSGVRRAWYGLQTRVSRWEPWRWVGLGLLWAVVLMGVNWQPFHFTMDPEEFRESDPALSDEDTTVVGMRRISWAPFVDYYWGSRYQALDQFARRTLSFAPLGVCLALAYGRRSRYGGVTTVVLATIVGVIIEVGQYFIPERHPGVTDLLIQVFGAWVGFQLTRHALHALRPDEDTYGEARYRYGPEGVVPLTWPEPPRRAPRTSTGSEIDRDSPLLTWLSGLPMWGCLVLGVVLGVGVPVGLVLLLAALGW